jgi:cysteine desulfurase/selenocysteine lyase
MIANVTFEKTTYKGLPDRYEAGTPHIAGAIGLGAAIDYLGALDHAALRAHERDVLEYGTRALERVPGLRLIGTAPNKIGVLSFVVDGIHPHDLGTLVDAEGVAIRTGHHCTQPLMARYGVPATARASLALFSTRDDVDRLVLAIDKAKELFR